MAEHYNFDVCEDRRNTNSMKWAVEENELPMWVADMDFKTAPAVIEAVKRRAQSGIYGYSVMPKALNQSMIDWWKRRHQFEIKEEWLIFCTGVIPAVTCAVKRMTNPGDKVLVQTPVYHIFFHSIENHGRYVLENQLLYENGQYRIDFDDLECKLSDPLTKMMILCNPQNPAGIIWSKEELSRIGTLCEKYHVLVLSDEIHCDLTMPGTAYTPYASVSETCRENSITCISTSKTFNLAGLNAASVFIPNEALRQTMERGLNADELAEPNAFAADAIIAAYENGEEWLENLRDYLLDNKRYVREFLEKEIPDLKEVSGDATYLLWLDCGALMKDATQFCEQIRKQTGLYLSAGSEFRGNGKQFIRMNIACPRERIVDAMCRLKCAVDML